MTTAKLNEFSQAEEPARVLLERLGWTYVPREALAEERTGEREVLLKGRLRAALLRLNEWLTEEQAERVIFELEHVNEVGIARNQKLHEYLTFGLPLTSQHRSTDRTPATSASSTSNAPTADSTSSSSPPSSGCGEAVRRATTRTTSG